MGHITHIHVGHANTRSTEMFLCPRHQISAKSAPKKTRNCNKAKFATKLRKLRKALIDLQFQFFCNILLAVCTDKITFNRSNTNTT